MYGMKRFIYSGLNQYKFLDYNIFYETENIHSDFVASFLLVVIFLLLYNFVYYIVTYTILCNVQWDGKTKIVKEKRKDYIIPRLYN